MLIYIYIYIRLGVIQAGNTTLIRREAVREADVSRYLGGPIGGLLKFLGLSQHYRYAGFKGALICAPHYA